MILILVACAVAAAAMLQSVSGFGFSLIFVPMVAVLVDSKVAVVAASTLGPLLTLSVSVAGWRDIRWRLVLLLSGSAVLGMPVGLWVLVSVSARMLELVIGSVVIVLAASLMLGVRTRDHRGVDAAAGFLSGVLATSTGTNGPPVVLAMQARGVPRLEMRATLAAVFLVQGILALVGFVIAGQFTDQVGRVAAVGLPGLLCGRLIGDRVFGKLDQRGYGRIVLGLLIVAGAAALVEALLGSR